jgi:hypothetical protein
VPVDQRATRIAPGQLDLGHGTLDAGLRGLNLTSSQYDLRVGCPGRLARRDQLRRRVGGEQQQGGGGGVGPRETIGTLDRGTRFQDRAARGAGFRLSEERFQELTEPLPT